jgi:hypothetical protein
MKSIEATFKKISRLNPCYSTYLCFTETIKGRSFSGQIIRRWFYKLVDKGDYDKNDTKAILTHLDTLCKQAEEYKK